MKNILFLVFALAVSVLQCNAQTDSLYFLNKTMEKLKSGDCDVARKFYNVYKEVYNNNKPVLSIEVLLDECSKKDTFAVGETMKVEGLTYIVAYTRDGGKHGLAIHDDGYHSLYRYDPYTSSIKENCNYISRKIIPTLEELRMIYVNRDGIRMYDVYWSCSKGEGIYSNKGYMVIDFSTGESAVKNERNDNAKILLIHRF